MIVTLQTHALQILEQIRAFVAGSEPISFTLADRSSAHAWMTGTLKRFGYASASRAERGLLRRYLAKVTGLSRAQITRRIAQFQDRHTAPAAPFAARYTDADILLLAELDALHGTLSGTITRKPCERAFLHLKRWR